jgi:hypothetical protein
MDLDELRDEYTTLREEQFSGVLDIEGVARVSDLWHELRRRTDVDQPECPECAARNWGFSDHTSCNACGYAPGMDEQDLLDRIQSAWDQIMHGQED